MKILALSGSTRSGSYNSKLVACAAEHAKSLGAEVTLLNLKDYPLPIFDEDLEKSSGLPETGRELKKIFLAHQGLLISSPEYNSSLTPLLLNTFAWISRSESESEAALAVFKGKVCSLLSASPGQLGGLRGLVTLRMFLGNVGVTVLPNQFALSAAHQAFNEANQLNNPVTQKKVQAVVQDLVSTLSKLG